MGPFIARISLKLKRLTRALQSWSQKQIVNINSQLALAQEIVHRLEIAHDHRALNDDEKLLCSELKKHCLMLASLERIIARQWLCIRPFSIQENHEVALHQNHDNHFWLFDASGYYSSKTTYMAFFNGKFSFEPWKRLWKSWAPAKCKVFLWLAIRNRYCTADRLARAWTASPKPISAM